MAVFIGPGNLSTIPPSYEISDKSQHPILKYAQKSLSELSEGLIKRCQFCDAIKPIRAHHCSLCRKCVLKMDHHCRIFDSE